MKQKLVLANVTVGIALVCSQFAATPAAAMSELRWTYRPVLIFAPTVSDARVGQQMNALATERAGLTARDIVVMTIVSGSVSAQGGPRSKLSAASLRARFGVGPSEFRVILVGKDGGTKLSSGAPVTVQRLFTTIDAMPMRRLEMRNK